MPYATKKASLTVWVTCVDEDLPQRFWLEEQIAAEQMHIEELEKLTNERTAKAGSEKNVLREVG